MTDENEVAPLTAEESTTESDSLLADIAEAAGVESIFDNANIEEPEEARKEAEEVVEEEAQEPIVHEDVQEEEVQIDGEVSQDSDGVKKRIGKLIEARDQAKGEVEKLKEQLEESQNQAKQPKREQKGLSRFDDVKSLDDLQAREDDAEHLREWLLANPDGGEYTDASGQEHDVEYDQARQLIVETDRDLRKNIPSVRQRLVETQQQEAIANQTFKWMSDQGSYENQELRNILNHNENLQSYAQRDPYAKVVLGYAIEGFKSVQMAKQQQKVMPKDTVAPQIPVAPTRAKPAVVKPKKDNLKSLFEKAKSGDVDDAASYLEKLL